MKTQSSTSQEVFAARDASRLVRQMNEGLINRQLGTFFSAFDLAKMTDGQLFRQQVTAFLSHTDSIRTHFNLTGATMKDAKGAAVVEAEMEADSRDGNTPPLHRQATLEFIAQRTAGGWKFTDVQPRSFFFTSSAVDRSAGASPLSR